MELVLLGVLLVVGAVGGVAAVAATVSRNRDRRNQVVPGVATSAPAAWAGDHTPEAQLHRRLIAAVVTATAAARDGDQGLSDARRAIEEQALAVDERLVTIAAVSERDRGPLVVEVEAQVEAVERAATSLARSRLDRATRIAGVEESLERVRLLEQARDEVERIADLGRASDAIAEPGAAAQDEPEPDDDPRASPGTG